MKTCKKCGKYDKKKSFCQGFNIYITSTLNATRCTKYDLDDKKERSVRSERSRASKINSSKNKRAEICIDCGNNEDGYCKKHLNWCSKVNYICNGDNEPYKYKKINTKIVFKRRY